MIKTFSFHGFSLKYIAQFSLSDELFLYCENINVSFSSKLNENIIIKISIKQEKNHIKLIEIIDDEK